MEELNKRATDGAGPRSVQEWSNLLDTEIRNSLRSAGLKNLVTTGFQFQDTRIAILSNSPIILDTLLRRLSPDTLRHHVHFPQVAVTVVVFNLAFNVLGRVGRLLQGEYRDMFMAIAGIEWDRAVVFYTMLSTRQLVREILER